MNNTAETEYAEQVAKAFFIAQWGGDEDLGWNVLPPETKARAIESMRAALSTLLAREERLREAVAGAHRMLRAIYGDLAEGREDIELAAILSEIEATRAALGGEPQ
jgi:hypothetical protein